MNPPLELDELAMVAVLIAGGLCCLVLMVREMWEAWR